MIPVFISNILRVLQRDLVWKKQHNGRIFLNFFKRVHIYINNPIDFTSESVVTDFEKLASSKNY